MDYIRAIERQQIREDIPQVRVADNVKVHYRIKEGDRERIQVFIRTAEIDDGGDDTPEEGGEE